MRTLVVFDGSWPAPSVAASLENGSSVTLFALSESTSEALFEVLAEKGMQDVESCETAVCVDRQVERLCRELPGWASQWGRLPLKDKTLREWLLLPDGRTSAYWLGPLSEKNPLKTVSFLYMAQILAVEEELRENAYAKCAIFVEPEVLRMGLGRAANEAGVRCEASVRKVGFRRGIRRWLGEKRGMFAGLVALAEVSVRSFLARAAMGPRSKRLPSAGGLLAVTYFPYLDEKEAEAGRFQNKYFWPLQEMLKEKGESVDWLLMYVKIESQSYRDALRVAKALKAGGSRLLIFEEFAGVRALLRVFTRWLKQIVLYAFIARRIHTTLEEGETSKCLVPVLMDLFRRTFVGLEAVRGLLFFFVFREFFDTTPSPRLCIYLFEMQAWEIAFSAAAQEREPRPKIVGYQHTSISRNYVFYRQDARDMRPGEEALTLPLPDVIACNGEIPSSLLKESGFSNVQVVESLRHIGWSPGSEHARAEKENSGKREPILLVAGSIVRGETLELLSLVWRARQELKGWRVLLKGHPSMPFGPLLRESGISPEAEGLEIAEGAISDWLERAPAVLVPTSSVAVEALGYGCEVFVPIFPSVFNMSPLAGYENLYRRVCSPAGLAAALDAFLQEGPKASAEEKSCFLDAYWCLDSSLVRWRRLLENH